MKLFKHSTRNGLQKPYGRAFFAPDDMPEEQWRPLLKADKLKYLGPFYVCNRCKAVVIEWESGVAPASATVQTTHGPEQVFTCPGCARSAPVPVTLKTGKKI